MKKVISLILLISILFGIFPTVKAATTDNVTLSANSNTVSVGDTVTVTLKTAQPIQSADYFINYSSDVLEFTSTSIDEDYYEIKSDSQIQICYVKASGADTFTFTFDVKAAGTATISTVIEEMNIDTQTTYEFEDKSITITATENSSGDTEEDDDENGWTDFSNAKFKVVSDNNTNQYLYLKISNVIANENNTYYLMISSSNVEDLLNNFSYADIFNNDIRILSSEEINGYKFSIPVAEYELNSDLYLYIIEQETGVFSLSNAKLNTIKLEKKSLLPLGNRISAGFTEYYTNLSLFEYVNEGRNVNIKVGIVYDANILRSIKNGENDSLSKLLTYAKSDKGIINTSFDYKGAEERYSSIYNLYNNWVDYGYYYVYMEYDNEDGKYMTIEDINLYQSLGNDIVQYWGLVDYHSNDFKWNLDESDDNPSIPDKDTSTDTNDKTTAKDPIPQTGESIIVITLVISLIVIAIISIIKYKKYRDI